MKKLISAVLLCSLILVSTFTVCADDTNMTDDSGIVYSVASDGTYAYVSDGSEASGIVSIPSFVTVSGKQYPVTAIAGGSFMYSDITDVTLPQSITSIEDSAFAGCSLLTDVDFGGASVSVGNKAFENCSALENIIGSSAVVYVGASAFDETPWIKADSSTELYVGNCLVKYNGTEDSFTAKQGTLSVSPYAFYDNDHIVSADLSGVTKIGAYAFSNCSSLVSVSVDDVLYIGDSAFEGCAAISGGLDIKKLLYLGAFAFNGCESITYADISQAEFSYLPDGAFFGCTSLSSVLMSDKISKIGNYSFEGCTSLSEVLAEEVTEVGYDAFKGCSALSDKTQFSSVEHINTGAFDGTSVYSAANGGLCIIGKAAYKTEQISAQAIAVDKGVKQISPYAFYKLSSVGTVAFPETLEGVGENAFYSLDHSDETNFFVFSSSDSLYSELSEIPCGTVYVPDGKTFDNPDVTIGTINGISVYKLPDKMSYRSDEEFNPAGMVVLLDTTKEDAAASFDVSNIGYACTYTYDFSESYTVTVEYCGYTTTLKAALAGDVDSNGVVNTDDLVLLRKYVAGLISGDDMSLPAADADGNSIINTDDIVVIRKIIAGLV